MAPPAVGARVTTPAETMARLGTRVLSPVALTSSRVPTIGGICTGATWAEAMAGKLAAPSANPFGYVSPTTAAHVAMPGSRLEIFPGVGHFPHNEAPDRFVDVLVDFMRSTEPARLSELRLRELLRAEPSSRSSAA